MPKPFARSSAPLPFLPGSTEKPRVSLLLSLIAATVAAMLADLLWGEKNWIRVVRRDLALPGLPPEWDGLRVGHISDLHCDGPSDARRVARAARLLLAEKPDVVVVTGDYLSAAPAAKRVAACVAALRPLALGAPRGAYAVLGNHDWSSGGAPELTRRLTDAGFHVLNNAAAPLPLREGEPARPPLWIVGLDDAYYGRCDVWRALETVPVGDAKLLLVHEPDYADDAPEGFLLQFSGHSHGGQIRLPLLRPPHLPPLGRRYYEGLRQGPRHPVYVSRGVGSVGIKARLFCPPEVSILRLCARVRDGEARDKIGIG